MNLAYGLYMAEAEGHLSNKPRNLKKLINDLRLRAYLGFKSVTLDNEYLSDFDLTLDDLTETDLRTIAIELKDVLD